MKGKPLPSKKKEENADPRRDSNNNSSNNTFASNQNISTENSNNNNNNSISNNNTKRPVMLKRMDTKISMFAPEADSTDFDDFPVLTICPHCRVKVVTKTGYSKMEPCCLCCCADFLFMFRDVHHTCPKCNQLIAKYNRFCVAWGKKVQVIGATAANENDSTARELPGVIDKIRADDTFPTGDVSDEGDERTLLLQHESLNNSSGDGETNTLYPDTHAQKNKKRYRKISKMQKPV